jgi:hypothetical protein
MAQPNAMLGKDDATVDSVLVADFGHFNCRAFLLEKIAGDFRFVGHVTNPTSLEPPHNDLSVGWLAAIRRLGQQTGRSIAIDDRLQLPRTSRGDGVDAMVACSSLGEPIRIALVDTGVTPMSRSVGQALRRTDTRILHETTPGGRKDEAWITGPSERIQNFHPDQVILLLDGETSHAAPRAIELIRQIGMLLAPADAVIYGPARLISQTNGLFIPPSKARILSSEDVEPEGLANQIEHEMTQIWTRRIERDDVNDVLEDAVSPPITRSLALGHAARMIARETGKRVLCVAIDEGSDIHLATGEDWSSVTLPRLDLSNGITNLSSADIANARRWLPFETTETDLLGWALNRSVRPWAISFDARDLRMEQALARPIFKGLARGLTGDGPTSISAAETIVISGQPGRWNDPGGTVLAVLDGLDHVPQSGLVELAIDYDNLLSAVGTMSVNFPDEATDVLKHDSLSPLGSALILSGTVKRGDMACQVEIERAGTAPETVAVNGGDFLVIPLPAGQTATLKVTPARKIAIGAHPAGKAVTFGNEHPAIGGEFGVIIDARGRPLGDTSSGIDRASTRRCLETLGSGSSPE